MSAFQEPHPGPADERDGHGELALLPAGEVLGEEVDLLHQSDLLHHLPDSPICGGGTKILHCGRELEMFPYLCYVLAIHGCIHEVCMKLIKTTSARVCSRMSFSYNVDLQPHHATT